MITKVGNRLTLAF